MKRPDFPLDTAIGWFLADKPSHGDGIEATTLAGYRSCLNCFFKSVPEPRSLASLNPNNVEAYARCTPNINTRRNRIIALKSLAAYLADKRLWYAGTKDARRSVLEDVRTPKAPNKGMPGYRHDEVRTIEQLVDDGPNHYRNLAVIAVERHGFRSKEARLMLLSNVILPTKGTRGHFVIDSESRTKRGTGGVRVVPMSERGRQAIQDYLRHDRPTYRGGHKAFTKSGTNYPFEPAPEPLFLTTDGYAIRHSGWHSMSQRFRRRIAPDGGLAFKPHRLRPTRAIELHEAGWTDSDIMEALGWKSIAMLRRYLGRVSVTHLKTLPEPMDQRAV